MAEILKICHDRILPQNLFRPQLTRHVNGVPRAVIEFRKLWINGSTLRVRFMGGTPATGTGARASPVVDGARAICGSSSTMRRMRRSASPSTRMTGHGRTWHRL